MGTEDPGHGHNGHHHGQDDRLHGHGLAHHDHGHSHGIIASSRMRTTDYRPMHMRHRRDSAVGAAPCFLAISFDLVFRSSSM